ncbi:MAG: GNAT family N-acetyltransferase [Chloroflexota bacterium]
MTKIKICGIKTLNDALAATEAGADYLGFNFYPESVRFIEKRTCAEITSILRQNYPHIKPVGVFVNSSADEVKDVLETCSLDLAQLHGDETPEMVAYFKGKAFKAIRLSAPSAETSVYPFLKSAFEPAFLMDAAVKGVYGGSGVTADWSAAAELAKRYPLLLAGGLTPENVADAVRQVRPWGVDVASGVESSPGSKDEAKMVAFVKAVRAADLFDGESIVIQAAEKEDLEEILSLQKLAYRSEAELNNDFTIPPLRQTMDEICAESGQSLFLKCSQNGKIIGSVRAHEKDGTCYIGRLIVHPEFQNQGIGSKLLQAIESRFQCQRFELFTSQRSGRNLYLYRKFGYQEFKQAALNEKVTLIFLEKLNDQYDS